jgi:hypothetical protein
MDQERKDLGANNSALDSRGRPDVFMVNCIGLDTGIRESLGDHIKDVDFNSTVQNEMSDEGASRGPYHTREICESEAEHRR